MAWVEDWTIAAGCRGMDPDELFVQGAAQNRAKVVCATCPVRTECLADALDNRVEYGVWGGMTERERRALLRRRPEVRSWRQVLEEARDAYLERAGAGLIASEAPSDLPGRRESVGVGVADAALVQALEQQEQAVQVVVVGLSA
ncbi:MAG TPA: WhiB family transcriptional regulator [Actinospica sp.]|nr:WhiB family transcriptional regulator [Actinospica sp.]